MSQTHPTDLDNHTFLITRETMDVTLIRADRYAYSITRATYLFGVLILKRTTLYFPEQKRERQGIYD